MKAAMCNAIGAFSDVTMQEVARPSLLDGTVRIGVKAASANPPDALMPQGKYQVKPELPFAIGLECAGVVLEVGGGVSRFSVGDRVMSYPGFGCFAEEVVVPEHLTYSMPQAMTFEDGAGFSVVYGTAYHALVHRGDLKSGETVVILGAGGGLGLCAVQIAQALGATVIAVASSAEKIAVAKSHGAQFGIISGDRELKDQIKEICPEGPHMVHDTVGGVHTMSALRSLRPYGRHLIVGYSSGEIPQIPGNYVLLKQVSVIGVSFRQLAHNKPEDAQKCIDELCKLWSAGMLRPVIAQVHPFEDFAVAVNSLSSRSTIGKQIVKIS